MSDDYLWDRSGPPDPDVQRLEELLSPLRHEAPLDDGFRFTHDAGQGTRHQVVDRQFARTGWRPANHRSTT